jgi:hypothetical protein
MMRLLFLAAGLALVSGCGAEREQAPPKQKQQDIVVRSPEQDQLHQLNDMYRDIAMKRAITASGLRCKRVTRSGYVTEYKRLSMWTASCDDGRDWAVFVGPDGTAQVRPCQDMAQFQLPTCQIAADPSGRTARGIAKQS